MSKEIKKVEAVAHHRNGVCGEPFYAVAFTSSDGEPMLGVVFDVDAIEYEWLRAENPRTAVFNRDLVAEGVVTFGVNSYRGDRFHDELVAACKAYEMQRSAEALSA